MLIKCYYKLTTTKQHFQSRQAHEKKLKKLLTTL